MIKKGQYSQAYLISQKMQFKVSFLVPLSALMFAIVSTDPGIEQIYKRLREQGMSPAASIEEMAVKFPFGKQLNE